MSQVASSSSKSNSVNSSILLLCDNRRPHANTVMDHINAFRKFSRHDVNIFNPAGLKLCKYLDLNEFQAVVVHYSINVLDKNFLPPHLSEKLSQYTGLKIQFIQDDYRQIERYTAKMREIGLHVLFTSYPADQIPNVWSESQLPGVMKISGLTGYVPDRLIGRRNLPLEVRPIDIGYRGRTIPYWLGELSQEKVWIGRGVLERSARYDLRCDIAWNEESRIYGKAWDRFLGACKTTLGTESGASITDFDGMIERRVREYLAENPEADFFEVQNEILQPYEGNVPIHVISPRMFEAIAAFTGLILFPGEYSGILKPWAHYIPLEKDFSNMDEVVEKLHDMEFMKRMTKRAYADIVASGNYSYREFIREFDKIVSSRIEPQSTHRRQSYQRAQFYRWKETMRNALWMYAKRTLLVVSIFKYSLEIPALRQILFKNLVNLKPAKLFWVIKDIALLRFVKRVYHQECLQTVLYRISAFLDLDRGAVRFVSNFSESHSDTDNSISSVACRKEEGSVWPSLEEALRDGRISSIVWDHNVVDESIRYHLIRNMSIEIFLSDKGVHNFNSVVKLAQELSAWKGISLVS